MIRNIKIITSLFLTMFFILGSLVVSAQNKDLQTILQKGENSYNAKDYKDAVKWFKQAYKFDKKSNEVLYRLASAYLAEDNYMNAAIYSGKIIAKAKNKTSKKDNAKANSKDYIEECYIIYGNAWDKMNRKKRAQNTYKEAIKIYPNNYLMYYHLANSLLSEKKYIKAEDEVLRLLTINPTYADAHLLLANIEYNKGERIKAMLPLYYYLLINQDSDKSENVYDFLNNLWRQGIRIKAQRDAKLYNSGVDLHNFTELEAVVGKYETSNKGKVIKEVYGVKNLTLIHFVAETKFLFSNISKMEKDKADFFENFYGTMFTDVDKNAYAESFAYFISDCKYKDDVLLWISSNYQTFKRFSKWMGDK